MLINYDVAAAVPAKLQSGAVVVVVVVVVGVNVVVVVVVVEQAPSCVMLPAPPVWDTEPVWAHTTIAGVVTVAEFGVPSHSNHSTSIDGAPSML